MNYNVLRNLLKQGNVVQRGLGAEVGVLYGDTSEYLLAEFPNLTLISIDPYLEYNEPGTDRSQATMSRYEQEARNKLSRFGSRSHLIKSFSLEVAPSLENESLDFVFIDANHEYGFVKQDLEAWFPKVRCGGLICGHDYQSWPGVRQAVDEFSLQRGLRGFNTPIASDVWFFVK